MAVVLECINEVGLRVDDLILVVLRDVVVVMRAGPLLIVILLVLFVNQIQLVHFFLELGLDLLEVLKRIVLLGACFRVRDYVAVISDRFLNPTQVNILMDQVSLVLFFDEVFFKQVLVGQVKSVDLVDFVEGSILHHTGRVCDAEAIINSCLQSTVVAWVVLVSGLLLVSLNPMAATVVFTGLAIRL